MFDAKANASAKSIVREALATAGVAIVVAMLVWQYVEYFYRYADPLPEEIAHGLKNSPQVHAVPARRVVLDEEAVLAPNQEFVDLVAEAKRLFWRSQVKHAALLFGLLGGLLAGGLAAVTPSGRVLWLAIVVGAALGIAGGVAARLSLNQVYFWQFESGKRVDPMVSTITVHAILWSILATGVAIACRDSWGKATTRVLAGLVAALVFTPLCSYLYPIGSTIPLVPEESQPRLLWLAIACLSIALLPLMFVPPHSADHRER